MLKKKLFPTILFAASFSVFAGDATNCLDVRKNQFGGQELFNKCGYPVEAIWCYYGDRNRCTRYDNQLTIGSGKSYGLIANKQVLVAGCIGADSIKKKSGTTHWCKD